MSDPWLLLAQAASKIAHRALGGDKKATDIFTPAHVAGGYIAGEKGVSLPETMLGGLTFEAVQPALLAKLAELGLPVTANGAQNLLVDMGATGLGWWLGRWQAKKDE